MGLTLTDLCAILLAVALALLLRDRLKQKSKLPLPPGPKKYPFIGNMLSIPQTLEWETYARWGRECGSDIIYLEGPGLSLIVLNSVKSVTDLLGERSAIYSSRPRATMVNEFMGLSWLMSSLPYGKLWMERRRIFHQRFHPSDSAVYRPRQLAHVHKMLLQLVETPQEFMDHIKYMNGGLTLSLAYGIRVLPKNDPFITLSERVSESLQSLLGNPRTFLADSIPLFSYILEYLAGANRMATERRLLAARLRDAPFAAAQKDIADGVATPSFVSRCLENLVEWEGDDKSGYEIIKDTAGVFFLAGSGSTSAALYTIILALLQFSDVQAKAQKELDEVVGRDRLPDLCDEASLPYLSAVIKEAFRWRPVAPIALPHSLTREDEYEGYRIPAHSIVIGNAWAMLHNEADYPNPELFRPERFLKGGKLDNDVRDPIALSFGFGRRACPGSHIALSTVWLTTASILSAFTITKPVDNDGKVIEPSMEYLSAVTSQPLPFKCDISPRHPGVKGLIRAAIDSDGDGEGMPT